MKRLIFLIAALLSLTLLSAQEFATKMETIYTSEHETAHIQHVKSAIDSKGNLHVVFTGFEFTFYGTNQSGAWKFQKLQYFDTESEETVDVIAMPNLVIDKNDNLHIVTFDRYKEKIVYAKNPTSSGEFKLQTVELKPKPLRLSVYGGLGNEYSDLAIDKNGGLHLICKSDFTTQDEKRYSKCATYFYKAANSDLWQPNVLIYDTQWDDRNWSYGTNSSIACFDDKVYVAIGGSNELHFAERNISGGEWKIEKILHTPDKFINSGKDMLSLAISQNGSIKFAFYDHTDDENSPWQNQLSIFSKNACGNGEWMGQNIERATKCAAIGFDSNGKFYVAAGRNSHFLWHQTCDCDSEYKKLYVGENQKTNFVDMVIDKKNTVYTFYCSDYDNQLRLLTAEPKTDTKKCNYPPTITKHSGKTNLKPGEKWTATITASDPECDKIKFESIIHNDMFTLKDNGNGTATITATMPEGTGKGTPGLSIWVLDDKHPNMNNETSVITFNLVITPEGKEKGSVKVENKCTGKNDKLIKVGETKGSAIKGTNNSNEEGSVEIKTTGGNTHIDKENCEEFLKRYEAFADEYAPMAKKFKADPVNNMGLAEKIGELTSQVPQWAVEWEKLHDCNNNKNFKARYETAKKKIDDANR